MSEPSVFSLELGPNPNKIYTIVPSYIQEMAIDINGSETKNGTKVQLWTRNNGKNQKFKIILNKDKDAMFEAQHCKNMVLDLCHSKVQNSTPIHLYTRNDTGAQYFHVVKAGDDCYSFLSSYNHSFCIDVHHREKKNGTKIQLYERNNTDAQKFKLIGENDLRSALAYALKYSEEPNGEYEFFTSNSAHFCSQCLYAGGVDADEEWNKNSYSFTNDTKLREYFQKKGVEWKEFANLSEVNSGDIIYKINDLNEFCNPIFIIKRLKDGVIYCSNSLEMNKAILNIDVAPGLLRTSSLFK